MFSSQLPKRNSVSIFPASRSTTRTRRACGSISRRTSRRASVASVARQSYFVACSAGQCCHPAQGDPPTCRWRTRRERRFRCCGTSARDRPSLPVMQWASANRSSLSSSRGSRCDRRERKTRHWCHPRGKAFVRAIRNPNACAPVAKNRQCPIRTERRLCRRNSAQRKMAFSVRACCVARFQRAGRRILHQR